MALFACVLATTLAGCTSKPIAVVNGERISPEEFEAELRKTAGEMVLHRMIAQQLIDDAFAAAGLTLDPAEVEEELQSFYASRGGEEMAKAALEQQGQTVDDLRRDVENNMKMVALGQKDLQYDEEDLKEYYKANMLRYDEPDRVRFSRIMLGSEQEANDVYKLCTAPDAKFPDLAKEYTMAGDPLRSTGGQLSEPIPEESITDQKVRKFVSDNPVGAISNPIESGGTWHILRIDEKLKAVQRTFEDAREQVEEDYKSEHMKQPNDIFMDIKAKAKVVVEDPEFARVQAEYSTQALLDAAPSSDALAPVDPDLAPMEGSEPVDASAAPDEPAPAPADGD